jgi:predicted Zn-dependent protease
MERKDHLWDRIQTVTLPYLVGVALLWGSVAAYAVEPASAPRHKLFVRTRTAVMGVRGLDEVDLKAAAPDKKALAKLERYAPSQAGLDSFGRFRAEKLVPVIGGPALDVPAPELADEIKMGSEVAALILGAAPLVDSPELQRYVNLAGSWVAIRSDRPGLKWRFGVLASDSINAFAVPGGYVFVTLGLYQRLRSESELAGVLGHEISHVVARDHYRMLTLVRSMKGATGLARDMMARLPAFKSLADLTLDHSVDVFTCALDREAELSADRMGTLLAADAGYEPLGLLRVLEVLAQTPKDDTTAALLFKTHPAPADRIRAVEPLEKGELASRASRPDMKVRFDEYDFRSVKLVRKTGH